MLRPLIIFLLLCGPAAGFAQSGTLIVLNKSDHTASLIAVPSYTLFATLPTGTGPHEAAVSPDGRWAVVANYGDRNPGNSLTLIDLREKSKVRDIDLGHYGRPHGIEWLSDGTRVAVTAEANKALLVVEIPSGRIVQSIDTDQNVSHMVALSHDNTRAYVANIGSGSVTVIDLAAGTRVSNIETGAGAEGIDITPDGKEVWVTNRSANTISIVDPTTLKVTATLPCADFPIRVKITPDGGRALVSNARSGDVAVFDVREKKEIARVGMKLSPVNESDTRLFGDQFGTSPVPVGILIPPDGTRAYIANTNADIVTVIDLKTLTIADRIKTGREPDGMAFSPLPAQ